jgi:hypothetical protein
MSARKDGSELTALASGLETPRNIAVDAEYVYFTTRIEDGTVSRVRRDGTGLESVAVDRLWPRDLRIAAGAIYWFDDAAGSSQSLDTSPIVRLDLATSEGTVLHEDEVRPHALALDGDYLYWTAQNFGDCNTNPDYVDGVVRRMPAAGGAVETLAKGLRQASDLVVRGDHLYWAQSLSGCSAIYSLAKP